MSPRTDPKETPRTARLVTPIWDGGMRGAFESAAHLQGGAGRDRIMAHNSCKFSRLLQIMALATYRRTFRRPRLEFFTFRPNFTGIHQNLQ